MSRLQEKKVSKVQLIAKIQRKAVNQLTTIVILVNVINLLEKGKTQIFHS